MRRGIVVILGLMLGMMSLLTGCGRQQTETEGGQQVTTLTLAAFGENRELEQQVEWFNQANTEYQIQIMQYERSEQAEADGIARLQREIVSGEGPDIIDFGMQYATSDIVGRYTEDLKPYLTEYGFYNKENYFVNIWDAFSYKEGLYALPVSFTLETFAGSKETLEGRNQWNIQEMIACYEAQAGERILYPGQTQKDVFGTILTGSMDYYIDWEQGACSFDGEAFQKVMAFANTFPDTLVITEDYSVKQTFHDGGALLLPLRMSNIYDICKAEFIFGEAEVNYIGFPVEGTGGTVIKPSQTMLAISVNSKHKDVAWEFISKFLQEDYQREVAYGYPVCRSVLEEVLAANQVTEYIDGGEGKAIPIVKERIIFEGEDPVDIYCITEKQAQVLLQLITSAEICSANDYQLYCVLLEEVDSYFSGDKSLEETAEVIQSRANIYVSERAK